MKRLCLLLLALFASASATHAQFALAETGGTFRTDATNYATSGTAFSSGEIGVAPHSTAGLNDGTYGNANSWIGSGASSAGIVFSSGSTLASFAFGRDNLGTYSDRNAGTYNIFYTTDNGLNSGNAMSANWTSVGSLVYDAVTPSSPSVRHLYNLASPISGATGFRIASSAGTAIDEIELYSTAVTLPPPNPGVSNLNLSGGSTYNYANTFIAQRFVTNSTGTDSFQLGTVSLNLGVTGVVNDFTVRIHSNSSNTPGSVLGTLTGATSPTTGQFDFVNGSVILEANTAYWVTWGFTSGAGYFGNVQLTGTVHTGDWTFTGSTKTYNDGAAWFGANLGNSYQISIQPVSAVPEPSTYAALCGVAVLSLALWRKCRRA